MTMQKWKKSGRRHKLFHIAVNTCVFVCLVTNICIFIKCIKYRVARKREEETINIPTAFCLCKVILLVDMFVLKTLAAFSSWSTEQRGRHQVSRGNVGWGCPKLLIYGQSGSFSMQWNSSGTDLDNSIVKHKEITWGILHLSILVCI